MIDKNKTEKDLVLYQRVEKLFKILPDLQIELKMANLKIENLKYEILDPRIEKKILLLPIIKTADELLEKLLKERKSLARFGDGEFSIMGGIKQCAFQKLDERLARRLIEVITSENEELLIGIADNYGNLEQYTEGAAASIRDYMSDSTRKLHWKFLKKDKIYYDAYVSRPFIIYKEKENAMSRFQKIKLLWENRKVIMVEGAKTRFGVGNDLFDHANEVKRILAPAVHSFERYDDILRSAFHYAEKDVLFLIALGPSAGVLAYDLCKKGYQAIDIGHLDLEYEWFLHGQEHRGSVKYKYNNEITGGNNVDDSELPKEYYEQVISDLS